MPRTAGGAAVNRNPVSGSSSRPVRCSTTGIRAASSQLCAGRRPVCVESMFSESMPTSEGFADDQELDGVVGQVRMIDEVARVFPSGRCDRSRSAPRDRPARTPSRALSRSDSSIARPPAAGRRRTLATTPSRSTIRSRLSADRSSPSRYRCAGVSRYVPVLAAIEMVPMRELGAGRIVRRPTRRRSDARRDRAPGCPGRSPSRR